MADKNAKKWFDIEEPELNKIETKQSEPNWNIYVLIFNCNFYPLTLNF